MGEPGDIVDRCRRGDPDALEQLVRQYGPGILRLLVRYVGDLDRAEELFQDTWVRVKSGLKQFRGQARVGTWVYQIALNLARDEQRRRAREPDWTKLARQETSQVPLEGLARQEELAGLQQAIDDLPEPQREALILNKLEGLTYREMAQITGSPEGTLRSRVHWAMVVLRKRLGP